MKTKSVTPQMAENILGVEECAKLVMDAAIHGGTAERLTAEGCKVVCAVADLMAPRHYTLHGYAHDDRDFDAAMSRAVS